MTDFLSLDVFIDTMECLNDLFSQNSDYEMKSYGKAFSKAYKTFMKTLESQNKYLVANPDVVLFVVLNKLKENDRKLLISAAESLIESILENQSDDADMMNFIRDAEDMLTMINDYYCRFSSEDIYYKALKHIVSDNKVIYKEILREEDREEIDAGYFFQGLYVLTRVENMMEKFSKKKTFNENLLNMYNSLDKESKHYFLREIIQEGMELELPEGKKISEEVLKEFDEECSALFQIQCKLEENTPSSCLILECA